MILKIYKFPYIIKRTLHEDANINPSIKDVK